MKLIKLINNIFLLLFFIIKTYQYQCSSYEECFNCYHCDTNLAKDCNCFYDKLNNKCSIGDEYNFISKSESTKEIFENIFKNCDNSRTKKEINYYCGEDSSIIFDSDNKIEISLPKINNIYGKKNLYCQFSFHVQQKDDKKNKINLSLKYDINIIQNMMIFDINDGSKKTYLNQNELEIEIKNVVDLNIYFYIKEQSNENPFSLSIENSYSEFDLVLIITIILLSLTFIIIIASIIVLYKRMKKNEEEIQNLQNVKSKKNKAKVIIDQFFEENGLLYPQKYNNDFEKKYGNTCTICLENFNDQNINVCITPCNHIFHKDCLFDWLHDNIENTKCPNCNQQFIITNEEGNYVINPNIINVTSKDKREEEINSNRNDFNNQNEEIININKKNQNNNS